MILTLFVQRTPASMDFTIYKSALFEIDVYERLIGCSRNAVGVNYLYVLHMIRPIFLLNRPVYFI